MELFKRLAAPFPADRVSWRVGSVSRDKKKAMALAYIDARDVMERLDDVMGPANWQRRYSHAEKKTICEIGIRIPETGEWIWKADGAGDSDIEAEKGAISDAFKRAAVNFGIGRYLYDLDSPWVTINEYKQIEPSELKRLQAVLGGKTATKEPAVAKPDPNLKKAQDAVAKAVTALAPLDTFAQAEWLAANPKAMEVLQWVKRNFPDLLAELAGIGVEIEDAQTNQTER